MFIKNQYGAHLLDQYIDTIIKYICQEKQASPAHILVTLLKNLIPHHTTCLFNQAPITPTFDLVTIHGLLGVLERKKNPVDSVIVDRVDSVIWGLNQVADKIDNKSKLFYPLSAFFSVFQQYRTKLSPELADKLEFKDCWNACLDLAINKILADLRSDKRAIKLAACNALGQLSEWIPSGSRADIIKELQICLDCGDNDIANEASQVIIRLVHWIPTTVRSGIFDLLLANIANESRSIIACKSLAQLYTWAWETERFKALMQESGQTLQSGDPEIDLYILETAKLKLLMKNVRLMIQSKDSHTICRGSQIVLHLHPIISSDAFFTEREEVVGALLTKLDDSSEKVISAAITVFNQMKYNIKEEDFVSVRNKMALLKDHNSVYVRSAVYEAATDDMLADVQSKLIKKEENVAVRIAAIRAMGRLFRTISDEKSRAISINTLIDIVVNKKLDLKERIAAIEALCQPLKQVSSALYPAISNIIHTVLGGQQDELMNVKIQLCQALRHLKYFMYPNACALIVDDLFLLMHERQIELRASACKALIDIAKVFHTEAVSTKIREKINGLMKDMELADFAAASKAWVLLGQLKELVLPRERKEVVKTLLQKLADLSVDENIFKQDEKKESGETILQRLYQALKLYADEVSHQDKVLVLCRMRFLAAQEKNCHHHAKILMNYYYNAYRQELAKLLLMHVPSENNGFLPRDVAHTMTRFAF
ncbi:HEAT repeat domain-containing protein [Aquicella lusitana]|uniref:Uncharacterized protein n=1 Tax=Aquicella lusitana TaxID=254246 RepID=A0A370GN56_9COXI|nr:hypothetical protein [Aquicella lusitana]RDI44820.1 hypothetical protein C8D86_10874 [Aquicella lusitana]VVC73017.1 hypothetical protein AQULUS_07450 [Aquicella lusitana]